jgi:hypothetical protein
MRGVNASSGLPSDCPDEMHAALAPRRNQRHRQRASAARRHLEKPLTVRAAVPVGDRTYNPQILYLAEPADSFDPKMRCPCKSLTA